MTPGRLRTIVLALAAVLSAPLHADDDVTVDAAPLTPEAAAELDAAFDAETLRSLFGHEVSLSDLQARESESVVGARAYDILVNGRFVQRQVVTVESTGTRYRVRFPARLLADMPFDETNPDLPDAFRALTPTTLVTTDEVSTLIPGTRVRVSTVAQSIDFLVPESWFKARRPTLAPVAAWDWGEPALLANYRLSADRRFASEGDDAQHYYGSFNTRANFDRWRLIADGSFSYDRANHSSASDTSLQNLFLTRIFPESRSRLKAGNFTTSPFFSQGVTIRGAEIYVDTSLTADDELDFVPVVTGYAQTQARVTVRRAGYVIYERIVSPGAFTLQNLPASIGSGDLEVTITEADGRERVFVVPFTTNAKQLRTGKTRWSVAAGVLDRSGPGSDPAVLALDAGYGLPFNTTVFGASQTTPDYFNGLFGAAWMIPVVGSVDAQWRVARTDVDDVRRNGQGWALGWNRYVEATGSYVSLQYEHYDAGDYRTIDEAYRPSDRFGLRGAVKSRWSLNLSQSMKRFGSLYGSMRREEREGNLETSSYSVSWSTTVRGIGVNLSLQQSHYTGFEGGRDRTAALQFTIPLDVLTGRAAYFGHTIGAGLIRTDDGIDASISASGTALENGDFSYSLQAERSQAGDANSFSASADYRANRVRAGVNASASDGNYTVGASLSGGLALLPQGLYLTRELYGGHVVAHFPDVPEAVFKDGLDATHAGETSIVTHLNEYRVNDLTVDVDALPLNVQLPVYLKRVVPADGAVVSIPFETLRGRRVLASLTDASGAPLPFGSTVMLEEHDALALETVTDEEGRAYFGALPLEGVLSARWKDAGNRPQRCRAPYRLDPQAPDNKVQRITLVCRPFEKTK